MEENVLTDPDSLGDLFLKKGEPASSCIAARKSSD